MNRARIRWAAVLIWSNRKKVEFGGTLKTNIVALQKKELPAIGAAQPRGGGRDWLCCLVRQVSENRSHLPAGLAAGQTSAGAEQRLGGVSTHFDALSLPCLLQPGTSALPSKKPASDASTPQAPPQLLASAS
ncbi:UNVERIFIED_CONTAM: hypothetical protein K2H54_067540 [Gekko kuhli]